VASLTRHGKKWRAQVYHRGVRRSKVFGTQKAARAWAAREEAQLHERADYPGRVPFADVLERYADEVSIFKPSVEWEARRIAWLKGQ